MMVSLDIVPSSNESSPDSGYMSIFQIWVNSPHNASGYYTIYGEESLQADHFNTKLSFGDPQTLWARTGYLGFVKRTELLDASGGNQVNNWLLEVMLLLDSQHLVKKTYLTYPFDQNFPVSLADPVTHIFVCRSA